MPLHEHPPIPRKEYITVEYLVTQLKDTVKVDVEVCTAGPNCLKRQIKESDLHRPGLALSGFTELFTWHRIQIFGNTECEYLDHLNDDEKIKAFSNLTKFDIPIIFITHGNRLPDILVNLAKAVNIPVFYTEMDTVKFMFMLQDFLDDQFALQTVVHGAMVDVYGIGIMIAGKAGIGKSEVALDLVERGHRLVSDDVIRLTKKNNVLIGTATDINKHFMEVRGLGIIDIMKMFGIRAVRYQKRLEVVVELYLWNELEKVDRTGLVRDTVRILDVEIPLIKLPITPGKNITVIAEVIAMNHLLDHYGYNAAKELQDIIRKRIQEKTNSDESSKLNSRAINYFEGDTE